MFQMVLEAKPSIASAIISVNSSIVTCEWYFGLGLGTHSY